MKQQQLRKICAELEGPDCDCDPTLGACAHVRAKPLHTVPLDDWSTLLYLCFPDEYTEPPPPTPSIVLSREARVAQLAERASKRQQLFHPDDLCQGMDCANEVQTAPKAQRARNGSVIISQDLVGSEFEGSRARKAA